MLRLNLLKNRKRLLVHYEGKFQEFGIDCWSVIIGFEKGNPIYSTIGVLSGGSLKEKIFDCWQRFNISDPLSLIHRSKIEYAKKFLLSLLPKRNLFTAPMGRLHRVRSVLRRLPAIFSYL